MRLGSLLQLAATLLRLAAVAGAAAPPGRQAIDLASVEWRAQRIGGAGDDAAVPATVPGDILAALERADALGLGNRSIYYGTNLESPAVQAAQNASYWLNASVSADAAFVARGRHTLIVDGLDYNATIFLNGRAVGAHVGPYSMARLPLPPGALAAAKNELALRFELPPHGLIGGWLAPGNGVQGVMWNFLTKWKSMVGIGYDFAQPLWSTGIQESAALVATDHLLLSDLVVLPALAPPFSSATLNASVSADADAAMEVEVTWTVARTPDPDGGAQEARAPAVTATTRASLQAGANRLSTGEALKVPSPALWWPNGFGEQPLYTLSVSVAAAKPQPPLATGDTSAAAAMDSLSRSFGIRDLKHVRNPGPDSWSYIVSRHDTAGIWVAFF
eukprot:COSAG04_NODE_1874_length_5336_cov_1.751193_7_plen_389_part_00